MTNQAGIRASWFAIAIVVLANANLFSQEKHESTDYFEAKIRPALIEHCLECHGESTQESGLRLDSRTNLLKGGERGPAIQLGAKVDQSLLLQALRHENDLEMPPAKRLPPDTIQHFTQWLRAGAHWPQDQVLRKPNPADSHWAFQPIRRPENMTPSNDDARAWVRSPVDGFVWAKLEEQNLRPSPEAARPMLIRRLAFDLTGLPPTPEEIDQFLDDARPDAYDRLVDRLLASPRFGERWGRYWLDVARYADNKGYVFFEDKNYPWAYAYRDYVIESLNGDKPYDRFLREQIAADKIIGEDVPEKRALRAMGFLTLGARFMNNTHDVIDDRIDVVMRGLLGLTVTCARCHDHKYDPITQADYYGLYGVFRSCEEPIVPPTFDKVPADESAEFDKGLDERLDKLRAFVDHQYDGLVRGAESRAAEYLLAAHKVRRHPPTDDFMLITDKGALNPTMILRWRIYLENRLKANDPVWKPWSDLAETPEAEFAVGAAKLLAQAKSEIDPWVRERLQSEPPKTRADLAAFYASVIKHHGLFGDLDSQDESHEPLRKSLRGPDAPAGIPKTLGWGFLSLLPDRPSQNEFKKLLKEVEKWTTTHEAAPPRAMVLVDSAQPYRPRIFRRGNPHRPGEFTERRFLAMLEETPRPFTDGSGRKELAEAIVNPSNPLTYRVMANRLWAKLFGKGMAARPDDFGVRSDPPSHPQLLDWLACELRSRNGSLKDLIREIVSSSTYRQSSVNRPDGLQRDPENRWLWRMNSRRRDFESLRDALLAAADSIEPVMGGPPLRLLNRGVFTPRRTTYSYIDRMDVDPLLTTFDFPNPAATASERVLTTTASQSLFFLNSRFVETAARKLTQRADVAKRSPPERVDRVFKLLFARSPEQEEIEFALQLLGDNPNGDAWLQLSHALLMSNEFLYVD